MPAPIRLLLVTPPLKDAGAFAPQLAAACAATDIAAVVLTLAGGDERHLVSMVKTLAPIAQETGAAVTVRAPDTGDTAVDLAIVATRGGADGVHVDGASAVASMRERLGRDRIVGAGDLRSRHDAMEAGEAGADYLLFGEPRHDGSVPPLAAIAERAQWWAEIFETPCAAYAPDHAAISSLRLTGAEFCALGRAVFDHEDGPAAGIREALAALQPEHAP